MTHLLIIGVALLAGLTASAAASAASMTSCPFTGPQWGRTDTTPGTKGTAYDAEATNVTCGFAVKWAKKLASLPARKEYFPIKGGPAGFRCTDQSTPKGPRNTTGRVIVGSCNTGAGQKFGWSPVTS